MGTDENMRRHVGADSKNHQPISNMEETPSSRMVELLTASVKRRPPLINDPSLYTPLIFANHDRKMKHGIYIATGAVAVLCVLFVDNGRKKHCFSSLREKVFGVADSLFTITSEDKEYFEQRADNIKSQIAQVLQ